jgi:hypothetical protein
MKCSLPKVLGVCLADNPHSTHLMEMDATLLRKFFLKRLVESRRRKVYARIIREPAGFLKT